MKSEQLIELATESLDALKGLDIQVIDIAEKSSIADAMMIATGTSKRHVRSLAESVRQSAKQSDHAPLGFEGGESSDWILVDLGDVIVHVMTQEKRDFYALEKLWLVGPDKDVAQPSALGVVENNA